MPAVLSAMKSRGTEKGQPDPLKTRGTFKKETCFLQKEDLPWNLVLDGANLVVPEKLLELLRCPSNIQSTEQLQS